MAANPIDAYRRQIERELRAGNPLVRFGAMGDQIQSVLLAVYQLRIAARIEFAMLTAITPQRWPPWGGIRTRLV